MKDDAGYYGDDVSLGLHDIWQVLDDALYLVDPFEWFDDSKQFVYE